MWCRLRTCAEAAAGLALITCLTPLAWRLMPSPRVHQLNGVPGELESEELIDPAAPPDLQDPGRTAPDTQDDETEQPYDAIAGAELSAIILS